MREHDFEPIRGLPADLPKGEHILWQGAPRWTTLANQAFHVRGVAAYFALMFIWRAGAAVASGHSFWAAAQAILLVSPIAILTVAFLAGLGWLYSRTTVYTITNKRVVIRFGVAMPKAFNIPFSIIQSAASKPLAKGGGDLALTLASPNKIAFAHLWPNVRPWRLGSPEPTLRALPDVHLAAQVLTLAMADEAPIEKTRSATMRDRTLSGGVAVPGAIAA